MLEELRKRAEERRKKMEAGHLRDVVTIVVANPLAKIGNIVVIIMIYYDKN